MYQLPQYHRNTLAFRKCPTCTKEKKKTEHTFRKLRNCPNSNNIAIASEKVQYNEWNVNMNISRYTLHFS